MELKLAAWTTRVLPVCSLTPSACVRVEPSLNVNTSSNGVVYTRCPQDSNQVPLVQVSLASQLSSGLGSMAAGVTQSTYRSTEVASERRAVGCGCALCRLATGIYQLRHDQMEQGPTGPHGGYSTFLLSFGGAGGGYC